MATLRQIPLSCSGHTRPVVHLDFSGITPDGYFLISACKDGKPMLRQGETGDWVGTFDGHKGAVWGATLNVEANRAATGAADFTATFDQDHGQHLYPWIGWSFAQEDAPERRPIEWSETRSSAHIPVCGWFYPNALLALDPVWDPVSGDELHSFAHKHIVKAVHFSKDSGRLLTGSNEKKLKIFDLANVDADPDEIPAHTGNIRCSLWCDNDKKLISASDDKTISIWDVSNQTEIKKITLDTGTISMELSKQGDVCAVSHGNKISFYDTDRFELIKTFDTPCSMNSASLHPDKSCFVAGGEDLKIYKFDYSDGKELESYKGHFGPVHCIRFSPDGELYASGSEDGTLRLWQTSLGKSYGLWKCIEPDEGGLDNCTGAEVVTPQIVQAEL